MFLHISLLGGAFLFAVALWIAIPYYDDMDDAMADLVDDVVDTCDSLVDQLFKTRVVIATQPPTMPPGTLVPPPILRNPTLEPTPTNTPEPDQIFYFSELGLYIPGRPVAQIVIDLEYISYIQGVPGMITQLKKATYDSFIMGRKFEAERAIYYYNQGALQAVNSTAAGYDLVVTGMGTINYIEVKWTQGALSRQKLDDVIEEARMHPSGTFLLETTWITLDNQQYLYQQGGRKYP